MEQDLVLSDLFMERVASCPENLILLYGEGGSGKSTLIAEAAAHIWKEKKQKTRVVGADGGGFKPFKPLIDKGILDYWPIDQWTDGSIFANLDLATKGWWPKDTRKQDSALVAPFTEVKACPQCGAPVSNPGSCASCGHKFVPGTRYSKRLYPEGGIEDIGLLAFEGTTAFGNLLMQRLRTVDPEGGRSIKDGEFKISAAGKQHYGDAQTYMKQFIANTRRVPIRTVIWTALELKGDDDGYGKPIYGPAFPGKALTALCVPWFTDVLHLDVVAKRDKGLLVKDADGMEILDRKLYLRPHFPPDAPSFKFAAKTSVTGMPGVIPASMKTYFEEMDKAYKVSMEGL